MIDLVSRRRCCAIALAQESVAVSKWRCRKGVFSWTKYFLVFSCYFSFFFLFFFFHFVHYQCQYWCYRSFASCPSYYLPFPSCHWVPPCHIPHQLFHTTFTLPTRQRVPSMLTFLTPIVPQHPLHLTHSPKSSFHAHIPHTNCSTTPSSPCVSMLHTRLQNIAICQCEISTPLVGIINWYPSLATNVFVFLVTFVWLLLAKLNHFVFA